ncbi:hypothetical protein DL766_007563 [Monosporascus sp. MC13-8B]|uniref:Modin n=1 Tax=Monosporascus cannonballus TaxID=155416 RepID=A0ABY0HJL6_9PEZI|nr:hypothetical protein DL762_000223 [Monosporascus cannonballus]RYO99385.1 hypothetical protein DL763_001559 [Monosporascus cannonballus]RYP23146.1 hypothetical protein DL766_007563 [Monosporascus sp. MC13-8B]
MADAGDTIAIVALVLATLALYAMVLQSAAQYIGALREQYRYCNRSVIGDWASSREYKFHFRDYRFEMMIKVPVLFISDPYNREGKAVDTPIYHISGTRESRSDTWTTNPSFVDYETISRPRNYRLWSPNATGFERATWLTMLSSLQFMEEESAKYERDRSPKPPDPNQGSASRTAFVSLRKKRLSWDVMPTNFRRPLAFTTIGDLIVIAAMLGTHWKILNRDQSSYHAEGNGLIFEGSKVDGIGLVFSFRYTGGTRFEQHRILPIIELKELSFGRVPTIFNKADGETPQRTFLVGHVSSVSDNLETLRLGNPEETAATLEAMGCHWKTIDYFKWSRRCTHLFPVPFELLGMLARNLHPRGSVFRMLPNPTYTRWNANAACSLFPELHRAYREKLYDCRDDVPDTLMKLSDDIVDSLPKSEYSKGKAATESRSNDPISLARLLARLHVGVEESENLLYVSADEESVHSAQKSISAVVSAHIDMVMKLINDATEDSHDASDNDPHSSITRGSGMGQAETAQELINIYVDTVMQRVIEKLGGSVKNSGRIWLVLVFRMLCWLTLHGFHPEDVQTGQGGFYQSALPVYIN